MVEYGRDFIISYSPIFMVFYNNVNHSYGLTINYEKNCYIKCAPLRYMTKIFAVIKIQLGGHITLSLDVVFLQFECSGVAVISKDRHAICQLETSFLLSM